MASALFRQQEKGNEFFKKRKYKEAVDCYSRSLALSPTAVAYANRAMAYLKLKRHVLAYVINIDEVIAKQVIQEHVSKCVRRKKKEKKMEERNEDDASVAALFSEGEHKVTLLR
ncbi:RNA polymerase II-associated protein 3 isoform X1 [Tanacetum coccineum]